MSENELSFEQQVSNAIEGGVNEWNSFRSHNRRKNISISLEPLEGIWEGANFNEMSIDRSNMSHLDLSRGHFLRTSCRGVDFIGTDLRWADFTFADLSGANFEGADLYGCRLDNARVDDQTKGLSLHQQLPGKGSPEGLPEILSDALLDA